MNFHLKDHLGVGLITAEAVMHKGSAAITQHRGLRTQMGALKMTDMKMKMTDHENCKA